MDQKKKNREIVWNDLLKLPLSHDYGVYIFLNDNMTDHKCIFSLCPNCYFKHAPQKNDGLKMSIMQQ